MSNFGENGPKRPKIVNIDAGRDEKAKSRRFFEEKKRKELQVERLFRLAVEAQNEGDSESAQEYYKEALEINPKDARLLVNLGALFSNRKDRKDRKELLEAKDYFLEALKANPDYGLAWFNLGCICEELNQKEEAKKYYQRAIKCNTEYADAYFNLALLQDDGNARNVFSAIFNYRKYLEFSNESEEEKEATRRRIKELGKLCTDR